MNSNRFFVARPMRLYALMLVIAWLVSSCSGSSDSVAGDSQNIDSSTSENGSDSGNTPNVDEDAEIADDGNSEPIEPLQPTEPAQPTETTTTQVDFRITVPAYQSDALQVRIEWGGVVLNGIWNSDELWTASSDLPINTQNLLSIRFNDRNGAITLASVEAEFRTGSADSEIFEVTVDQFDTARWDSDNDGVSNLDELRTGSNPDGGDLLEPVQASLELIQDKTFRLTWQATSGAEFYRVLENPDGVTGFINISGDLEAAATKFEHRVALYARVNASYIVQSCNSSGCTDSDAIGVSGTLDEAIGYFKASNTEFENQFGDTVSLSMDGNTMAVGASGRSGSGNGGESDAVYVFQRNNGSWFTQAILSSNTDDGFAAGFGSDISLSADGNTLAIGSINESLAATQTNGDQIERSGAVYVFVRVDSRWQQQEFLTATNAGTDDWFGSSVSLSANGNTVAIGARFEDSAATGVNGDQDDNSTRDAGAVYVFQNSDGVWQQQAYIKASNTEELDSFGGAVSISADGNTLAVGVRGESSAAIGINGDQSDNSADNAGAVYVFVQSNEIWQQRVYIKASNTDMGDFFGAAVSLSADGNTLAVGAVHERSASTGVNGDQDDEAQWAGAVYVFESSDGAWQQQAYLKASNTANSFADGPVGAQFGGAVSLSGDGNTLAVGSASETSFATGINGDQSANPAFRPGAVYVFNRSDGGWQQQAYVKASNTDSGDAFGGAVSLSLDGYALAVGAIDEESFATGVNGDQTDNSGRNAVGGRRVGAVYLY